MGKGEGGEVRCLVGWGVGCEEGSFVGELLSVGCAVGRLVSIGVGPGPCPGDFAGCDCDEGAGEMVGRVFCMTLGWMVACAEGDKPGELGDRVGKVTPLSVCSDAKSCCADEELPPAVPRITKSAALLVYPAWH